MPLKKHTIDCSIHYGLTIVSNHGIILYKGK